MMYGCVCIGPPSMCVVVRHQCVQWSAINVRSGPPSICAVVRHQSVQWSAINVCSGPPSMKT